MKILLHMGLRKTGTTSLQNALFVARDQLRRHGVLYPDGGASRENHRLLTALFMPEEHVKREVKYLFDFDSKRLRRAATEIWDGIRNDVDRCKPKLLVLSSEYFSEGPQSEEFEALASLLWTLSEDVQPILYFREPAAHYASNVQQNVKKGKALYPFDGVHLKRDVLMIEAAFQHPIQACVADRDQLIGGDIVTDFVSRFVAPLAGEIVIPTIRMNESMSAEQLAILDRFWKHRYPNHVGIAPDVFSLRSILGKLEQASGRPTGARLKVEVAVALRRAALDLPWLRERYGIEFKDVDYAAIDGAPFVIDPASTTIEDLFEVDPDRRDALYAAALAEALGSWRQLGRMLRLSRFVSAGGGLFSRARRSEV